MSSDQNVARIFQVCQSGLKSGMVVDPGCVKTWGHGF